MKVIGLTGGIASGKSTVTTILQKRFKYIVIDADALARLAVKKGSIGLERIVDTFGVHCLTKDGELNRGLLGEMIAEDENIRKKLNAIVHPEVKRLYDEQLAYYESAGMPMIFFDCPLLFEVNLQNTVDEIMLVVTDEEIRINRIMERDGVSRELAEKKINMQMKDPEKIEGSDIIIVNNGTLDDLLITLNVYFTNRKPWVKNA
ncbi:dephospho-CoA kinase [Acetobacterium bakii]|uniref:Dephospho-CoA kinase n=1 Tax=Acetobacterium bakii TaxID=52689 RepID=A0A0L6TYM8_9FIRM|nr:dephospho-CoA kinase [Acetobacterium bakii]KNZ41202.1 hypothetical protein AKG39_12815 [Acetobacterium bakii]